MARLLLFLLSRLLLLLSPLLSEATNDTEALTVFRTLADAHGHLAANWTGPDACSSRWLGVGCSGGTRGRPTRVTSLSLHSLDLRGPLDLSSSLGLSRLDQLKLLDLSNNRLNGTLTPSSLPSSLKLLYLSGNDISGHIPMSLARLTLLARLDLSDNNLDGPVPGAALANLTRLLSLFIQDNLLSGPLPDLSAALPALSQFNASNNRLYGAVPNALLARFGPEALAGNAGLCGPTPPLPVCSLSVVPPRVNVSQPSVVHSNPSSMPPANAATSTIASTEEIASGDRTGGERTRAIVGIAVGNAVFLLLLLLLLLAYCYCSRHYGGKDHIGRVQVLEHHDAANDMADDSSSLQNKMKKSWIKKRRNGGKISGESDEGDATEEAQSKLVFFEEENGNSDNSSNDSGGSGRRRTRTRTKRFGLEELLRSSAEMLGKGSLGTVYRAVLEDGSAMAVKRLKDANPCPRRDFHKYMDLIGKLRHLNLVPLKAYYFAKQEKLLIYEYLPNGSLFSVLHGNRGLGRVPLDWTTRVSVLLGAARGLAHIHEEYSSARIPHGNIKSANVLLDKNGIARVSDFGLALLLSPVQAVARLGGYMAPEQQADRDKQLLTQEADVYSFGVMLLEVLTGRAPTQYPPPKKVNGEGGHMGIDLVEWVKSVVSEEWTAEVFDTELMRYKNIQEEMVAMLQVALACVALQPDRRPIMADVVKMIEDIGVVQSPLPEYLDGSRNSLSPSLATTNNEDGLLSC